MPGKFLTVDSATSLHLNLDTLAVLKKKNNQDIMTASFSSIMLFPVENKMTQNHETHVGCDSSENLSP